MGPDPRPIDLMIVGAQKAATTSALDWLRQHEALRVQIYRDIGYFTNDEEYARGYRWAADFYFRPDPPSGKVVAKHANLWSVPSALVRLREHNPTVTVVTMLRDPIQRAWSAYRWAKTEGWERADSFLDALRGVQRSRTSSHDPYILDYLGNGLYADKIENLYRVFGQDRVHVVFEASFGEDPTAAFSPALGAIGVRPPSSPPRRVNVSGPARSQRFAMLIRSEPAKLAARSMLPLRLRRRLRYRLISINTGRKSTVAMTDAERTWLADYYRDPNARLQTLLGVPVPWMDSR